MNQGKPYNLETFKYKKYVDEYMGLLIIEITYFNRQKLAPEKKKIIISEIDDKIDYYKNESENIRNALALTFLDNIINNQYKEETFKIGLKVLLQIGVDQEIFLNPEMSIRNLRINNSKYTLDDYYYKLELYKRRYLSIAIEEIRKFYNKQRLHKNSDLNKYIKAFLNPLDRGVEVEPDSPGTSVEDDGAFEDIEDDPEMAFRGARGKRPTRSKSPKKHKKSPTRHKKSPKGRPKKSR